MSTNNSENSIIAGRNPVREALRAGREIDYILVQVNSGHSLDAIRKLARENGVSVRETEKSHLDRLAGKTNHQGVIAYASPFSYASVEDILRRSEEAGEPPFIIVLDGIEDPHNLGAIIRTAECAGAGGVIIPERRAARVNETVLKTSAGAVSFLPVARVTNIARTLGQLKERGIWIYALDMDGSPYQNADISGGVALVIGNEGKGISMLVREKCDFTLSIPMKGRVQSLNASNAAAILMYHVRSTRDA